MKTLIFYIALFVGSVWTFNAFASGDYLDSSMRWVEANRDLLPKEDVDYCNNIIRTGHEAIAMRDEGLTLEDTLADLDKSVEVQEKKHKTRLRREVYLELERMIRTVFRHPDMTIEEYNRQFFAECISVGRY